MAENKKEYAAMGERIRKIRKEHGLTQGKLAQIMEATQKHISEVEQGSSTFSLKQLIKFCEHMDCSLDYIVLGNSTDSALSALPEAVIDILNGSDGDKKAMLQRYLRMFVELVDYQE